MTRTYLVLLGLALSIAYPIFAASPTIECGVSYDSGATWTALSGSSNDVKLEDEKFRFTANGGNSATELDMHVYYKPWERELAYFSSAGVEVGKRQYLFTGSGTEFRCERK